MDRQSYLMSIETLTLRVLNNWERIHGTLSIQKKFLGIIRYPHSFSGTQRQSAKI